MSIKSLLIFCCLSALASRGFPVETGSTGITHPYVSKALLGSWIPPTKTESEKVLSSMDISSEVLDTLKPIVKDFHERTSRVRNELYTTLPFNANDFPNAKDLEHIYAFMAELEKIKLEYCAVIDEILEPEQQQQLLLGAHFGRVFQIDPMMETFLGLDSTQKSKLAAIERGRIPKYVKHVNDCAEYWKTFVAARRMGKSAPLELTEKVQQLKQKETAEFHCVAWGIFLDYLDVLNPEQQTKALNFCGYGVQSAPQGFATFETKVRRVLGEDPRAEKILERFKTITEIKKAN